MTLANTGAGERIGVRLDETARRRSGQAASVERKTISGLIPSGAPGNAETVIEKHGSMALRKLHVDRHRAPAGGRSPLRLARCRPLAAALLTVVTALGASLPIGPAVAQSPPKVVAIEYISSPASGDIYHRNETISVRVEFDKAVTTIGTSCA